MIVAKNSPVRHNILKAMPKIFDITYPECTLVNHMVCELWHASAFPK